MLSILSIAKVVPDQSFTQDEVYNKLNIKSEKAKRFFKNNHIKKRHLHLDVNENYKEETSGELFQKQKDLAPKYCQLALMESLNKAGIKAQNLDFLLIVTSTSFLVPSLSSKVANLCNLNKNCQRLDVVGMGCNAGMNALRVFSDWTKANPSKFGALICCELGSCMYSLEDSDTNHLVNSLFGDGVVSLLGLETDHVGGCGINFLSFESFLIPNSEEYLRYDWNNEKSKYSFVVEKDTPKILSQYFPIPIEKLLSKNKKNQSDVDAWILHSGGEAILDGIQKKLNLDDSALIYTRNVLSNFGNISSGSFLVSLRDYISDVRSSKKLIVLGSMGPGLSIELALAEIYV